MNRKIGVGDRVGVVLDSQNRGWSDCPALDPIGPDVRLGFVHEGNKHISRGGQVEAGPVLFPLIGDFDVRDRWAGGIVRMRVVDGLKGEAVLPHVFDGVEHVLGIHDERDFRPLFRRQPT